MSERLNQVYPDEVFGAQEALFVYQIARSLDTPEDKTIQECAKDAVRTASRQFDRQVDVEIATKALLGVLLEDAPQIN